MQRLNDERGAFAIMVAVLLTSFLGMGALVVDMGALYQERRELQSGADAAALAIAEDCLRIVTRCTPLAANATAKDYLGRNASDGRHASSPVKLGVGKVTVSASTETGAGSTSLTLGFARAIGFADRGVGAGATAIWGAADRVPARPIAIAQTEYAPGKQVLLCLKQAMEKFPDACQPGPGMDAPGLFGYLESTNCKAIDEHGDDPAIGDDVEEDGNPGNDGPKNLGCGPEDFQGVIFLPVYGAVEGKTYTIVGFAALDVDGFKFTGNKDTWEWAEDGGDPPCTGNGRCISGRFVDFVATAGEVAPPGSTPFGVSIIRLVKEEA